VPPADIRLGGAGPTLKLNVAGEPSVCPNWSRTDASSVTLYVVRPRFEPWM
jgi:hypothetical protein